MTILIFVVLRLDVAGIPGITSRSGSLSFFTHAGSIVASCRSVTSTVDRIRVGRSIGCGLACPRIGRGVLIDDRLCVHTAHEIRLRQPRAFFFIELQALALLEALGTISGALMLTVGIGHSLVFCRLVRSNFLILSLVGGIGCSLSIASGLALRVVDVLELIGSGLVGRILVSSGLGQLSI